MFKPFITLTMCVLIISTVEAAQQNIILVIADDFGTEAVSSYGSETYQTPNIDKLAGQGLQFTNAYVQPWCEPTRLEINTGYRFPVASNKNHRTLAQTLANAGYKHRALIGKWHLYGYWSTPKAAGFTEEFWLKSGSVSRYWAPQFFDNGQLRQYSSSQFGPDILADEVTTFLQQHRNDQAPWFLYYAMVLPHKPLFRVPGKPLAGTDVEKLVDMAEYMDKLVGRLLNDVNRFGLDGNTVILFIGDNGSSSASRARVQTAYYSGPARGAKLSPVNRGTNIPFIIKGPGIPSHVTETLVDAPSVYETIANLANAQTQGHGVNVLEVERQHIYQMADIWREQNRGDSSEFVVRKDGKKAYRVYKCQRVWRLYDIWRDPEEATPLQNAQLLNAMKPIFNQFNPNAKMPSACF